MLACMADSTELRAFPIFLFRDFYTLIPGSGKYSFEYNPTTFENVYAQDLYGYYTGKKNATYIDVILKIRC